MCARLMGSLHVSSIHWFLSLFIEVCGPRGTAVFHFFFRILVVATSAVEHELEKSIIPNKCLTNDVIHEVIN